MNPVKSRTFKIAVFVCTSHVLYLYRKVTLSKFFVSLIFAVGWNNENTLKLFPIYSISILSMLFPVYVLRLLSSSLAPCVVTRHACTYTSPHWEQL